MYKRILVPIDGSANAERAVQEAIKLAAGKAQLRLVYVAQVGFPVDEEWYDLIDYDELEEALHMTGMRALGQAAEMVRESGMTAETALREEGERIARVIFRESQNWLADLIVISSHGRSGLTRPMLGSVAEEVLRESPVPVLLVRNK